MKVPNNNFHRNPSSGSHADAYGRHDEANTSVSRLCEHASHWSLKHTNPENYTMAFVIFRIQFEKVLGYF
jgi:hypothetical protein